MMGLLPNDQRRAALSAGLLVSEHDGEVVAAARALVGFLKKGDLDPASVVSAGLSAVSTPPVALPGRAPSGFPQPMSERARMARYSPHINEWERDFLNDMIDRLRFSPREENKLKSILRKSEGVGQ
jgi:hypothetical protein